MFLHDWIQEVHFQYDYPRRIDVFFLYPVPEIKYWIYIALDLI